MRAGSLDTRITFEAPSRTIRPDGSYSSTWEPVGKAWASVRFLRANERFQSPKPMPVETASLWLRYRRIDASWRVLIDGQPYRIVGRSNIGRREGIELTVERFDT